MSKKGLYILSTIACIVGYVWLIISWTIADNGQSICLFKRIYHIPCPACGSTRAVVELCHGNVRESFLLNPNGILLGALMVIIPVWLIIDLSLRKDSFYRFYQWVDKTLGNKVIFFLFFLIVLLNWFWNIYKDL